MKARDLKRLYKEFFQGKEHAVIPSAPLIPEHDPTVLFTTAGMHPLIPFIMGQPHPLGKRIVNVQKCMRTQDIDEVGDTTHTTFFEMLGNWSFGDYFKKEAIAWSWEFLTSKEWLGLDPARLAITCFTGDKDAPRDEESARFWQQQGVPPERIAYLGKEENWWGPAGATGPCGPDTEMFYWKLDDTPPPVVFDPEDENWVEIWNDVFMQYEKQESVFLIDGMHCLYDKKFKVNKKLLAVLDTYPNKKILVINAQGAEAKKLLEGHNFDVFTLERAYTKDDPVFFKKLLKKYKLAPEQTVLLDHSEQYIAGASKAGIEKTLFTFGDVNEVGAFLKEHQYCFIPLKQPCVDTGLGVERVAMALQGKQTIFDTELFQPLFSKITELTKKQPEEQIASFRIIADHLRAACFILSDERAVTPSNVDQGYILRRFIRRSVRHLKMLGVDVGETNALAHLARVIIGQYHEEYPLLKKQENIIIDELEKEQNKFLSTLEKGLRVLQKEIAKLESQKSSPSPVHSDKEYKELFPGKTAFLLFQSYGFPLELTQEILDEHEIAVDTKTFNKEFTAHQELSRAGAEQKFKGGLSEATEATTRLHTATHVLNEALRKVLSPDIRQRGSNITPDRLRFDFNFDRKLTAEEKQAIEDEVNRVIDAGLDITKTEMSPDEAIAQGAQSEFGARYPDVVSVYKVGEYSMEICMGPHVKNTRDLGHFRIKKEQSSAAGIRRIKAVLE